MMLITNGLPLTYPDGSTVNGINESYGNVFMSPAIFNHNGSYILPQQAVGKKGLLLIQTVWGSKYQSSIARISISINNWLAVPQNSTIELSTKFKFAYSVPSFPSQLTCGVNYTFFGSGNWRDPNPSFNVRLKIYY